MRLGVESATSSFIVRQVARNRSTSHSSLWNGSLDPRHALASEERLSERRAQQQHAGRAGTGGATWRFQVLAPGPRAQRSRGGSTSRSPPLCAIERARNRKHSGNSTSMRRVIIQTKFKVRGPPPHPVRPSAPPPSAAPSTGSARPAASHRRRRRSSPAPASRGSAPAASRGTSTPLRGRAGRRAARRARPRGGSAAASGSLGPTRPWGRGRAWRRRASRSSAELAPRGRRARLQVRGQP